MPIDPDNLPSDVATLRAMMAAQQTELVAARAGLLEQRYEIEALRARLARALRVAFGRSSEKLRDQLEQLELTLADLDETIAATSLRTSRPSRTERRRASPHGVRSQRRCRATSSSMPHPATPPARASNVAGYAEKPAECVPALEHVVHRPTDIGVPRHFTSCRPHPSLQLRNQWRHLILPHNQALSAGKPLMARSASKIASIRRTACQPVHATAHVGGSIGQPDPHSARWCDHRRTFTKPTAAAARARPVRQRDLDPGSSVGGSAGTDATGLGVVRTGSNTGAGAGTNAPHRTC
jgi:hypothetical protein